MLHDNVNVNEKGHLTFGGLDIVDLAKNYSTPLMLLDVNKIKNKMRIYKNAMKKHFSSASFPCYASKALSITEIYRIAKQEGIGIDVVSSGEIYTAKNAGFDLSKAFFHGNNKTDFDISYAIENGVGYIRIK